MTKKKWRNKMTRAELIESLSLKFPHISNANIEAAVKCMLEKMSSTLESGERVEIRGFGSFNLSLQNEGKRRNPKTGAQVKVEKRFRVRFKAGKEMRDRVISSMQ